MCQQKANIGIGKQAENLAADCIEKAGLRLIARNFRCRFGEVDLVAMDDDTLVFIEVRYRKNEQWMGVIETVDQRKLERLIITSEYFVGQHHQHRKRQCRFDVIGITGSLEAPAIEWIKNAFQA